MKLLFKKSFPSDLREAKKTVLEALSFLRDAFPSMRDDQAADLRLVFNELLVNAVVHGNLSDTGKKVSIEIEIKSGCIYSRVTDEGDGFDYKKTIKEWNSDERLLDTHGRGVRLAYHMTDTFNVCENGNIIEFSKRLVEG